VVWDKTEACRPQPNAFRNQSEFVCFATKGGLPPIQPAVYLPGVIRCPAPRERQHMTEKPVGLLDELLRLVPAGGVVCDPFAGSGTTGEAAGKRGLHFIGCEWSDAYHHLATVRLRMAQRQGGGGF
jgi:site-specific DNA-methyltransferase (adenine-specific)